MVASLALGLTFVELKRDNAISTPDVDENPGLVVCPPPFTAKGVLHAPRIFSCTKEQEQGQREQLRLEQHTLQFCSRPQPSRAPPSMQSTGCSKEHNAKCPMYTQVRLG